MTIKTLVDPSGRRFMLGRHRPKAPAPRLRIANYMLRKFPTAPDSVNYITAAQTFLADILGNDQNGDCTCAAAFHIAGSLIANAGAAIPPMFDTNSVLALYYKLTGGQDTGLDEQVVFNQWQANGLLPDGSHKIATKVWVDARDEEQVKAALWLFGNLYIVMELPDAWVSNMPSTNGFTWGTAGQPDPENGHAICALAYSQGGLTIDTWGLFGNMPMSSLATYAVRDAGGGCYAVLSQESINVATSKAPNGFDWSQLNADIASFQP